MLFACKEWCCNYLLQIEDKGPGRRQSHTASVWEDHVIIAGGMDQGLRPLASVFMFSVHTRQHTLLQVQESLLPRYKKLSSHLDPLLPPPPKKKFIVNSANYYIFMNVLSSVDDWQVLPYSPRDWQSADIGGRSQCQSLSAGRGCHWYWKQESEGVLYTSKWATSDYTIVHCKNVRPSCHGQLIINVTGIMLFSQWTYYIFFTITFTCCKNYNLQNLYPV